jgi:hypothetical protein
MSTTPRPGAIFAAIDHHAMSDRAPAGAWLAQPRADDCPTTLDNLTSR